jgi:Flp pilus assembly protein TadD
MAQSWTRVLAVLVLVLPLTIAAAQTPNQQGQAEALFSAGLDHLREGRSQQALDNFKRAIKEDAKNPYFYKGLGAAYLNLKKYDDAVTAFRKALELNPYYVDVHNDLGTALVLAGKRDEGRKEFMKAYEDPTNPTPEVTARNLGQSYYEEKNNVEALGWFRTCANRNHSYPDCYILMADTLVRMGRLDEAIGQLESASKSPADDACISLALGEAYYRAGRFADARAHFEQTSAKDATSNCGRDAAERLKNFPK